MKRLAFLFGALALTACLDTTGPNASNPLNEVFAPSLGVDLTDPSWHVTQNGTFFKDEIVGTGESLVIQDGGDSLFVEYTGWLKDGTQFDADTDAKFTANGVIIGFIDGIVDMRTGGQRLVVIPSNLGFGNAQINGIPRNSTLVFRIKLNNFKNIGI